MGARGLRSATGADFNFLLGLLLYLAPIAGGYEWNLE